MEDLSKRILFVGGKGGVGKSTTAAATAWHLAEQGLQTLLVSTDPAHNLGDIFHQSVGHVITQVTDHLHALEIDPKTETEQYIAGVKKNIENVAQASRMDEIHRHLDTAKASPGAEEAALFDKLITLILEQIEHFDRLVFDTAPTGHTIRLLTLPELMGVWVDGLLQKRKKTNEDYSQLLYDGEPVEDPIFDVLQGRRDRFAKARDVMLDPKQTGFIFVMNPERLSILETEKAITMLDQYHLHVKTLIVNKVLPSEAEGTFYNERKAQEQTNIQWIENTFTKQDKIYIPLFPREVTTLEDIKAFSHYVQ